MKQCGPKVAFSNDFLGGGHPREVATACTVVVVIQYSIKFIDGQTSTKYGVDPSAI
jgi:hypothetical protein